MAKLRAPVGNGEVLAVPGFDAIPALVEENRRRLNRSDVRIGGLPLRELRELARKEVLPGAAVRTQAVDGPLILAGHQPELAHPGVWVKNFALCGLAKKLGGIGLNLIVDNDTLKSTSLRFPVLPARDLKVHLESVAFDRFDSEVPYEDRDIHDRTAFESFATRSEPLWSNWGYEPLLKQTWPEVAEHPARTIGDRFTGLRHEWERRWGCFNLELKVTNLTGFRQSGFCYFAHQILGDLPRFREVYNAAILAYRRANGIRSENHPAPELAEGEAPFWVRTSSGRRERATAASDPNNLRPRALTLTLFARVCLGDFFIHGIGGGKYDEVTDTIIREYFGIEPPAYQVLSATLHLPLPGFPSTADDLKRAEHLVRDLHWNPQRHITPENLTRPEVQALVAKKAAIAASEPPPADHAARKTWFRELQLVTEELRHFVWKQPPAAEAQLRRIRNEVEANEVLHRRDYSWVLYPEETLRPFLQQFLNV